MGLLDAMFGGGTKLELKLDTAMIPEGGTLAGTVSLTGGKKPLKLTALKVRLVFVNVTTKPGQSMPTIDLQVLLDNTVIANQDLPPGQLKKFAFNFQVPKGTDPKGTYKVVATADIPSVKDPSAEADLKVVAAPQGRGGLGKKSPSQDDILGEFPGLMSADEESLSSAIYDLQLAAYDEDKNLTAIAGYLIEKMQASESTSIKASALECWGTILNNRAKPEHIRMLESFAGTRDLDSEVMEAVVEVAAKFAEEGAFPLVQKLCRHPDRDVRLQMARKLGFDADESLDGLKELLVSLTEDADPGVRKEVFGSFRRFTADAGLMQMVANRASTDPSPDVQQACLSSISLAHHDGQGDLVFATYTAHLRNPHSSVRKEIAENLHWLDADPRLTHIVQSLLRDGSQEVRRAIAWQSVNMGDHPELKDVYLAAATGDADEEVRGSALQGVDRFLPLPEAVAFLRQRLQQDPTEETYRGALRCMRDHAEDAAARTLLAELAKGPHLRVAESAREYLAA